MNTCCNSMITFGCGAVMGMIITVTVIMFRQIWQERHCTCGAEALENHAPDCPLSQKRVTHD